jgi:hypothetical protein
LRACAQAKGLPQGAVLLMNGQVFTAADAAAYGQGLDWLAMALGWMQRKSKPTIF